MINVFSLILAKYSQISQRQIFAGSAIICLTHKPSYGPAQKIPFINSEQKLFWVSTMCA